MAAAVAAMPRAGTPGGRTASGTWLWGMCAFSIEPGIGSGIEKVGPAVMRCHPKSGDSYIGGSGACRNEAVEAVGGTTGLLKANNIGETKRRLGDRFAEHLHSVRN
eukprot:g47235.t1